MTEKVSRGNKGLINPAYIWLADLIIIWLSVFVLQHFLGRNPLSESSRISLILASIAYIPAALYIKQVNALQRSVTTDKIFINSIKAIIIHALVFLSLSAFLHIDYSITFYVIFYSILVVVFPLTNLMCRVIVKRIRKRGHFQTNVAIVGTNNTSERLAAALEKDSGFGYNIVGFFDDECLPDFNGKYVGDIDQLGKYARENKIDEIYFTLVGEKAETMPKVVKIADDNVVNFYYVPKISRYVHGGFQLSHIGPMPLLTLRPNPLSIKWRSAVKRAFDITFSSVFLIFSPLIFIPVAIGIKISSPGPVFFKQERTGYQGRTFKCYKFRTMRVNADADKAQATEKDPRKTKFGNFLRKTSIDELPQFINVWLGDMSVVGPRPHMLKHTEDYTALIDKYMVRHIVRPGITGWAQVHGYRGITDQLWKMEKRVECDVWYIENWTFSLDLKIIARTVINAVHGEKNAF